MTLQEIEARIKTEVLKCSAEKPIPLLRYRLNALQYGVNKTDTKSAPIVYSPEIINATLNSSLSELKFCFEVTKFIDEKHKVNTILLIMTKHIQEGAEMCKENIANQERLESLDNGCLVAEKSDYKRKSKELKNEELWNDR
jgi:hypothetical protein